MSLARLNQVLAVLCGVALFAAGVVIWMQGELSLPTRHPPRAFRFEAGPLLLLGLSPASAGALSVAIGAGVVDRESMACHALIGVSLVSLALAFLLAPKF